MIILNIETATEVCSVAISEGVQLLALEETTDPFAHSRQITQLIQTALQKAQIPITAINAIALSQGPGSYTGLRVGASTAKGICYALNKPLIAIDTLAALAGAAVDEKKLKENTLYCPMIDARRMEVYTALYDAKGKQVAAVHNKILDEHSYQEYFEQGKTIVFNGNGVMKAQTVIHSPLAHFLDQRCSASFLIKIASNAYEDKLFADVAYFEPMYYKTPNITKSKKSL